MSLTELAKTKNKTRMQTLKFLAYLQYKEIYIATKKCLAVFVLSSVSKNGNRKDLMLIIKWHKDILPPSLKKYKLSTSREKNMQHEIKTF